ncbi:MAG: 2-dehydropantoate 2-reductase N-terminal domain-containing protein, partial [candidate division WOR-3 bacterium]
MAGLQIRNVGIIGGGAWGLTLANLLSDNGLNVLVWDRNLQRVKTLKEQHLDPERLPGIVLNKGIDFTNNLAELSGFDIHILAVKSEAVGEMTEKLKDLDIK